jgi:hypothetical protein
MEAERDAIVTKRVAGDIRIRFSCLDLPRPTPSNFLPVIIQGLGGLSFEWRQIVLPHRAGILAEKIHVLSLVYFPDPFLGSFRISSPITRPRTDRIGISFASSICIFLSKSY